jgi:two-component system response regulator NreC
MEKLRILLANHHELMCSGLEALITREGDMEVVGKAQSGPEVLEKTQQLRPDLIIMDINMPDLEGVEATARVKEKRPEVKVLALSAHENKSHLRKVLREGGNGYIVKRATSTELMEAIRTVAAGGIYIHASLAGGMAELLTEGLPAASRNFAARKAGQKGLSERERDVLRLMALGYSNKEIAAKLKISTKSVDTYKTRFMEKLGLKSRVEMVSYAKDEGLLDEE